MAASSHTAQRCSSPTVRLQCQKSQSQYVSLTAAHISLWAANSYAPISTTHGQQRKSLSWALQVLWKCSMEKKSQLSPTLKNAQNSSQRKNKTTATNSQILTTLVNMVTSMMLLNLVTPASA